MELVSQVSRLKEIIDAAESIVFLGGAGTSTESGIADFRSKNGMFNKDHKFRPEKILSHNFFLNQPKIFYDFYKDEIINLDAKPNAGHAFLVALEKSGKLKAIITQNIDRLHQMAGSKNVLELHGNIYENECIKCHHPYDIDYVVASPSPVRCAACEGLVKPNVILYDEDLNTDLVLEAVEAICRADLLIVSGTSLNVFPAADFLRYGNQTLLLNETPTSKDIQCDYVFHGKFAETFAKLNSMND